jgi:hypothetical protein
MERPKVNKRQTYEEIIHLGTISVEIARNICKGISEVVRVPFVGIG